MSVRWKAWQKSKSLWKTGNKKPSIPRKRSAKGPHYSILWKLSRFFFKQLSAGTVLLYLGVQLVQVVGHGQEQDLGRYLFLSSQQETAETVILLDHPEGSFGLDGAVHAQQDTLLAGDALQRRFSLLYEFLGDTELTVALGPGAVLLVRTARAELS